MVVTADGPAGAPAGPAQRVTASMGTLAPRGSLAAPFERGRSRVPSSDRCREPVFEVLGALGMLAGQGPSNHVALDRLGQIQPGTTQWGVEWHHPMGAQPADDLRRLVAGEVVPDQERAQRRQVSWQRKGLAQALLPDRPRRTGRLRTGWRGGRWGQSVQDVRQFLLEPRM